MATTMDVAAPRFVFIRLENLHNRQDLVRNLSPYGEVRVLSKISDVSGIVTELVSDAEDRTRLSIPALLPAPPVLVPQMTITRTHPVKTAPPRYQQQVVRKQDAVINAAAVAAAAAKREAIQKQRTLMQQQQLQQQMRTSQLSQVGQSSSSSFPDVIPDGYDPFDPVPVTPDRRGKKQPKPWETVARPQPHQTSMGADLFPSSSTQGPAAKRARNVNISPSGMNASNSALNRIVSTSAMNHGSLSQSRTIPPNPSPAPQRVEDAPPQEKKEKYFAMRMVKMNGFCTMVKVEEDSDDDVVETDCPREPKPMPEGVQPVLIELDDDGVEKKQSQPVASSSSYSIPPKEPKEEAIDETEQDEKNKSKPSTSSANSRPVRQTRSSTGNPRHSSTSRNPRRQSKKNNTFAECEICKEQVLIDKNLGRLSYHVFTHGKKQRYFCPITACDFSHQYSQKVRSHIDGTHNVLVEPLDAQHKDNRSMIAKAWKTDGAKWAQLCFPDHFNVTCSNKIKIKKTG